MAVRSSPKTKYPPGAVVGQYEILDHLPNWWRIQCRKCGKTRDVTGDLDKLGKPFKAGCVGCRTKYKSRSVHSGWVVEKPLKTGGYVVKCPCCQYLATVAQPSVKHLAKRCRDCGADQPTRERMAAEQSPPTDYKVGEQIILITPDNPRMNDRKAIVSKVESWGCHVDGTGTGTGVFRALWSEMRPVTPRERRAAQTGEGGTYVPSHNPYTAAAPNKTPTGEICTTCQGVNMIQNGSCKVCLDCGTTTGCS